jgi:Fic-DOC domain mobile mystery protein B
VSSTFFNEPPDATPLNPEERDGLKQPWVLTRSDLNTVEQSNILKGMNWARRRRRKSPQAILSEPFLLQLHKHMFDEVWDWAGTFRTSERNIGIQAFKIQLVVNQLFGDVQYWIENKSFNVQEIAIRFHHQLVSIHPFPNGNGRHSRFMADLLNERLGGQPFKWSGGSLADTGQLRTAYITALRAADSGDIVPLINFSIS